MGKGFEIISADSRQIYQHMDIGTDKVSKEVRQQIPHHMIDVVTPDQTYTAGQRKAAVEQLIPEIQGRCNIPLVVGGTGLYIDMLYKNFSMPEVAPDPVRREQMMQQEEKSPGWLFTELQQVDPDEAMKHHPHSTRYILRALEIYTKT
jgi:tRNA dimethylallyltransferase